MRLVKARLNTMPDQYKQWNGITMHSDIWLDGMPLKKDTRLDLDEK